MDTNTFYSYSLQERLALVSRSGDYLCRIPFYGYQVHLYAFDGILIEVYYNKHNRDISEIEILDPKDERLQMYAVQVNLSDLYSK